MATSDVVDAGEMPPDRPGSAVPLWAQALGVILVLVFMALSAEAYFGPGLRSRLLGLDEGGALTDVPSRVFYMPRESVRIGEKATGSQGQERTLLEGDAVLLGSVRQLVRLGPGGRAVELRPPDGTTTTVTNLGAWDRAADRLTGTLARYQSGEWTVGDVGLRSVGAALNPPGAPAEALTDGFWLGPDSDAGRVRRSDDRDVSVLRLRASRKLPLFTLESQQPLQTLDGVLVSVSALVRAQPGKLMVLTIKDVVDGSGNAESVTDRSQASDNWARLTARRRMEFPSAADGFSIGLMDAEAGDWIEIRDLDVVHGVAP